MTDLYMLAAKRFWGAQEVYAVHDAVTLDVPTEHRWVVARLMVFAEDAKAYPDPYRAIAACRFNVGYDAVTRAQREIMKRAFFADIYGSNPAQMRKLIDGLKGDGES